MTIKNKIADAQWILEKNLSWIASADVKAGVIITLNIAMLGGLAATYADASVRQQCLSFQFVTTAAILEILSTAFTAFAIFPRLDGPDRSLIYFGKITHLTLAEYNNEFRKASDNDFLSDLTEQIHRNAEIAKVKHIWVKRATITSFISSISWVLAIYTLITNS